MLANNFSLNELKSAVINEDLEKLEELSKKKPCFSSIEEARELISYIEIAKEIINKKKSKLLKEMQQLKKIKNYTS